MFWDNTLKKEQSCRYASDLYSFKQKEVLSLFLFEMFFFFIKKKPE